MEQVEGTVGLYITKVIRQSGTSYTAHCTMHHASTTLNP